MYLQKNLLLLLFILFACTVFSVEAHAEEFTTNIMAVAVPVSEIFNTTTKINSNKASATISFNNVLGKYLEYAEYQEGSVHLSQVYS